MADLTRTEIEAMLEEHSTSRNWSNEEYGDFSRTEFPRVLKALLEAMKASDPHRWKPSSFYRGYEERINTDGYLETRPIDDARGRKR